MIVVEFGNDVDASYIPILIQIIVPTKVSSHLVCVFIHVLYSNFNVVYGKMNKKEKEYLLQTKVEKNFLGLQ